MDFQAVFVLLVLLALVAPVTLPIARSPESGAQTVALCVARTGLMASGALLVVLTVPLTAANRGPDDTGSFVGSYLAALAVTAAYLACERHIATRAGVELATAQEP